MSETFDAVLKGVTWTPVTSSYASNQASDAPYATHAGEGEMLGVRFRCYRLNDGRAVIHADDMHSILDALAGDEGSVK